MEVCSYNEENYMNSKGDNGGTEEKQKGKNLYRKDGLTVFCSNMVGKADYVVMSVICFWGVIGKAV